MKEFIKKMLHLGAELQKAEDAFHCSMIINDAEKLYKKEIEALNLPIVGVQSVQLCQHDNKVTNRICDDCGQTITYVPD